MIKIKTNEEIEKYNKCELFDNNDNLIGEITSGLILTDVCVQIKEQKLSGYYVIFNSEKIEIQIDGRIYFKNERPFTAIGDMLRELI